MGIDIKGPAVVLARRSLAALTAADAEYSATAAPARFELHNVFTPSTKHQARARGKLMRRCARWAPCKSTDLHWAASARALALVMALTHELKVHSIATHGCLAVVLVWHLESKL